MARAASDERLARLAQAGDEAAEHELAARHRFMVATIINREGFYSHAGSRDDLIQHGFIGLLAAIRSYRPDRNTMFRTYASTCIRNEIIGALRSERAAKNASLTGADSLDMVDDEGSTQLPDTCEPTPEDRLLSKEYAEQLAIFITTRLTEREREVLAGYARGYSYAEIAHQLSISTKAVDGAIQRVRRKMTEDHR